MAAALTAVRLEAILIGNAAAAIQGAPVTTVDFDFMFRATPVDLAKLKKFEQRLEAMILRPYYRASALYRVVNDDLGLQADFMPMIHGVKSFHSLRSRAGQIEFSGNTMWVASLNDVIASKRWSSWRKRCVKRNDSRRRRDAALRALKKESERDLVELIRRRLALPVSKRMNFLRVRRPGGSHL